MSNLVTESMGHGKYYIQDLDMGKKIMNILEKYYAGHSWLVDCNHEAGHGSVQLMYEGKDKEVRVWKYGYLFHLNKLDPSNIEKRVMMAGGEILERYNMARRAIRENDMVDFLTKDIITDNMVL